jgi:hypothetical protein
MLKAELGGAYLGEGDLPIPLRLNSLVRFFFDPSYLISI